MSERHQAWWLIAVGGCLQVALAFHWELTPSEALTWAHTPWLSAWTQAFPPSLWAGAARLPGIGLHVLALLALSGWARRPRSMVVLGMCTPGLGGVALWASEVGWASSLWALALAGMLTQGVGIAWAGVCLGLGVSLGGEVAFIMGITVLACTTAFPASARRWSWPWACTTLGLGWAWGRPLALPLDGGDPIQTAIHLLLLADLGPLMIFS